MLFLCVVLVLKFKYEGAPTCLDGSMVTSR